MVATSTVESGADVRAGTGVRLVSLDVFRGGTMAAMVLVNNPGDGSNVYTALEHSAWSGWTFTDTVFPFFLWIVGVAMTLSFAKRIERGDSRRELFLHVLKRAAIIFGIGLFLNAFPFFHLSTLRYPGVLQRIAVCYLAAASLFLVMRVRGLIITAIALLAGYWLLMAFVPVPGCGAGHYGPDCNLERYVDGMLITGHMYTRTKFWDPEGTVSTLPAIATTLFGILTGYILRRKDDAAVKTSWMFLMGVSLLGLGLIFENWLPINKNLWTTTFSVFMAGLAGTVFACCYWLVDVQGWKRWGRPLAIYGMNAIAVYIAAGVVARLLGVTGAGKWIFQNVFAPLASPINASLLYAIANVLFFYGLAYMMYRRKWFLRF